MRLALRYAVMAAPVLLFTQPGIAAPLDPAACEQLRLELSALEKAGARTYLAKGTGWAMANLKPDQLDQVEKLIDNDAQYLFRCPQPKKQLDPVTEALMEHGTGSDPDPDAAKPEAAPVKPVPKRKPPAAAQASQPPATADTAPATAPAPVVAKPAPKPKPKPVDAFVPPEPSTKAAGAAGPKQTAPQ
jgi:hypothetical protein